LGTALHRGTKQSPGEELVAEILRRATAERTLVEEKPDIPEPMNAAERASETDVGVKEGGEP